MRYLKFEPKIKKLENIVIYLFKQEIYLYSIRGMDFSKTAAVVTLPMFAKSVVFYHVKPSDTRITTLPIKMIGHCL